MINLVIVMIYLTKSFAAVAKNNKEYLPIDRKYTCKGQGKLEIN